VANKKKILFLVSEFWQAGGERQAFEFNRTLDKTKFQVDVFCLLPLEYDRTKDDFYFDKHIDLGSTIFFWDNYKVKDVKYGRLKSKQAIEKEKFELSLSNLNDLFKNYSFFLFFGEYTFGSFIPYISKEMNKRSVILIHNSIFQVPFNYERYDKNAHFHFVSGFLENEIAHELGEFHSFEHTYVPLSIDCSQKFPTRKNKYVTSSLKKIGIFTRLTNHKPLDVFYYALHLLKNKDLSIELLIFGNGNPIDVAFNDCIQYLGLQENIKFMGHQTDIQTAAVEHELDLVWFHSYYGVPGGYASFDISMTEIPQIFWDFTPGQKRNVYPDFNVFDKLDEFVLHTQEILEDEQKIRAIGIKQREAIQQTRNLQIHIKCVEQLIDCKSNDQ
jgi:glycosyltransferase involved in cell wall biosynthesis